MVIKRKGYWISCLQVKAGPWLSVPVRQEAGQAALGVDNHELVDFFGVHQGFRLDETLVAGGSGGVLGHHVWVSIYHRTW